MPDMAKRGVAPSPADGSVVRIGDSEPGAEGGALASESHTPPTDTRVAPNAPTGRRLGANISALAGSQAATWLMTLLWTVVVPRALGPAEMGVLVVAWSATAILGVVLGLGTRTFLVREMVARPAGAASLTGTAIILRLCLAPLFVVAVVIYLHVAHYGPQARLVLMLATGATFLTMMSEPFQAAFQATERMQYLAYSDIFNKAVQSLVGVGLALAGYGAAGLTASWLVVAGVVVVLNAWWMRPHLRIDLRTDLRMMRSLVRGSMAYYAFGLFYMVYLWIDSVMLGLMVPAKVVGWYGVPTKLFTTLMFVPVIISTAWLPRMVAAFEEGYEQLGRVARAPLELVVVLSFPACVGAAMLAGPVIRLLYGASYGPAVPVMVILALCLPLMYLNIMLNQVLVAANRPLVWTWVMAGAAIVNPVFNFVLVRMWQARFHNGAIGAAISMVLTEALIVTVGIAVVGHKVIGLSSLWRVLRAAAASAGMWGVMDVVRPFGPVREAAAGGLAFLALAAVLRLASPAEVALLRLGAARLRGAACSAGRPFGLISRRAMKGTGA